MIELMLPALVASLILVGIHGYLGIHIIARGVIFVDLALAQVAAFGWAAAGLGLGQYASDLLGIPEAEASYAVGLAATLIAAGLFSISRMQHKYVPQEAIIGIVYVVASAGTILLAAQGTAHGHSPLGHVASNLEDGDHIRCNRTVPLVPEKALPDDLSQTRNAEGAGMACGLVGFPVLCPLRCGSHFFGGHRRRTRCVQLSGDTCGYRVLVYLDAG